MDDNKILIRPSKSFDDMERAETLQLLVWPGSEMEIVPNHLLLTISQSGDVVLGAFDGEMLVGVVMGFFRHRFYEFWTRGNDTFKAMFAFVGCPSGLSQLGHWLPA